MKYTKKLNYGATLCVEKEHWYICLEMQGPDTRYKRKPFYITEDNLEEYCSHLIHNFEKYEQLKKDGNMTLTKGEGNHWIRFGLGEGVCLYGKEYPIKRREKLEQWMKEIISCVQEARIILKEDKLEKMIKTK